MSALPSAASVRKTVYHLHHKIGEQRKLVSAMIYKANQLTSAGRAIAVANSEPVPPLCFVEVASEADFQQNFSGDGAMSGVAIGVSDCLDVSGFRTRHGVDSAMLHGLPAHEFPFVSWLRRHGAQFVGKLATTTPLSMLDSAVTRGDNPCAVAVANRTCHYAISTSMIGPASITAPLHYDVAAFKPTAQSFSTFSQGYRLGIPSMSVGMTAGCVDDLLYLWQVYTGAIQPSTFMTDFAVSSSPSSSDVPVTPSAAPPNNTPPVPAQAQRVDPIPTSTSVSVGPSPRGSEESVRPMNLTAATSSRVLCEAAAERVAADGETGMENAAPSPSPTPSLSPVPQQKPASVRIPAEATVPTGHVHGTGGGAGAATSRLESRRFRTSLAGVGVGTDGHVANLLRGVPGPTGQRGAKGACGGMLGSKKLTSGLGALLRTLTAGKLESFRHPPRWLGRGRQKLAEYQLNDLGPVLSRKRNGKAEAAATGPQIELSVGYPAEWIDEYCKDTLFSSDEFYRRILKLKSTRNAMNANERMEIIPLTFDIDVESVIAACQVIALFELSRTFDNLHARQRQDSFTMSHSVASPVSHLDGNAANTEGNGTSQFSTPGAPRPPSVHAGQLSELPSWCAGGGFLEELPDEVVSAIFNGRRLTELDYYKALRTRDTVVRSTEEQFRDVDLIVCPVLSEPYVDGNIRSVAPTLPFTLGGNPMVSVQLEKDLTVVLAGELGRDTGLLEDSITFLQFVKGTSPGWWRRKFLRNL